MKKLICCLIAGSLALSAVTLSAAEKRVRIRVVSARGGIFGTPVAYEEVAPGPAFAVPTPAPSAQAPNLQPIPDPPSPSQPSLQPIPVELYHRVKYEDLDNIHPLAVKKIVAVKDPCATKDVCGSCQPPCVYVMICVPPCDKFKYEIKRKDHSKVEYDYGDYEVEITSKKGVVYVDYDD